MKKMLLPLLSFVCLHSMVFGQNEYTQEPTLGVHFFYNDFYTAQQIRTTSLSAVFRNKEFGKIKNMSPGLAVNYIQGLNNTFDFTTMLAGSFVDYIRRDGSKYGKERFLLEGDVSIRAKMFPNKYVVSPYLQAGVGASMYQGTFGAFIPAGVGVQFNLFDAAYLLVNSQYRIPVSDAVNYHFFHSVGLASSIGKRKTAPVLLPPPPLPQPPKDTDGDGVVDSLDACPDVAGLAQFNGCPDTDGDGIPDKEDKCPNEKGVARYQGCPVPDTDGDGINDEEDKCPNEKGVARYQGCPIPDRDKDGVNDEEDKCPDLPGTRENNGCPEIKAEIKKRIDVAASNIFFATGSFKLLAKSNKSLDDVVKLLNEDANLKLDIEGHTDNTGQADKNQLLSESRAKAVYDYFVKKGVSAERLRSAGFGQDQPVADNKTAAGRAKNRRVELKLHYD
ncbi:MAG: OmpA family protein [Candidatus Pseudobacter hemicellulosilyticus]|uniref:OmpA family protein n=1 Tax=Candidatus Pseudobacter hemicellulosilyticus TaxID=3121375 RepID=A0AAJ5WTA9_9BACT|nr:MAG: OmpA family protein [Pseudobacter sp.]